jgi:beta-lactamase superfamily II metal-dependent hydrolase
MAGGNGNNKIRVRMYRVGFGDCFLLTLPTASGWRYVLIDCGVHSRGNIVVDRTSLLERAFDDICAVTQRKLAIVIATHAHQDHISGFGKFASKLGGFSIDEVWLPWTEDPNNAQAQRWREKRANLVEQLQSHFAALGARGNDAAAAAVANASFDQQALNALHSGFGVGAKVRYLKAGDNLSPAGLAGLSVQILGPPQDQQFLAEMDPPAGQRYLQLDGNTAVPANAIAPFSSNWQIAPDVVPAEWPSLSADDLAKLQGRANAPLDGLAFALDQVLNNTSLVTLFVYQGQHLLFAGDAQYGNWKFWLDQQNSSAILSQITFYKVAHHGSMNATPKGALENMRAGSFAAMISTQNTPWPSIPRLPLVEALEDKTAHKVVRSDSIPVPGAPAGPALAALPPGFRQGDFWYECSIPPDGEP